MYFSERVFQQVFLRLADTKNNVHHSERENPANLKYEIIEKVH